MTDEAITGREQWGPGVPNPDVHDQWYRGEDERTAPAASPATTSRPPSWWQQCAGAHDLKQAQKRGQLSLE